MSETSIEVVDLHLRPQPNKTLFVPLTDPLMILHGASDYIIKSLGLNPICYIRAPFLPPTMFAMKGVAVHPVTVFGAPNTPLYVLKAPPRIGEEAFKLYGTLARTLVDWAERNEFERIVVADIKQASEEKPKVYFAAEERLAEKLTKLGFEPFTGVFTSESTYFLDECMRSRVDGIVLIIESVALSKFFELLGKLRKGPPGVLEAPEELVSAVTEHDEIAVRKAIEAVAKISGVEISLEGVPALMEDLRDSLKASLGEILEALIRFGHPTFVPV